MNLIPNSLDALQELFSSSLNGECYDLKELAQWCQENWPNLSLACKFKEQLLNAIERPGVLTPEIYEMWTDDDSYPTQDKLQHHLKEIWNACFPREIGAS